MSILFTPASIGKITLKNRLIMAPMQQREGTPEAFATDYHVEHYSRRAKGGVGLVMIESTSVSKEGRLFTDDIGIFTDEHGARLKKVAEAIHAYDTPVVVQLCHGGRKSSPEAGGTLLAPSAIAFDDYYGTPEEITEEDMQRIKKDFADSARRTKAAGFDGIELHAAHGYLLHQFLSPLSNQRKDQYGGSLENRVRYISEVLEAVRKEVGSDYPVLIRFSASDYVEDGLNADEVGKAAKMLLPLGLDAVHVSSGGLLPQGPDEVFPGYQVEYAKTVKPYVNVPVIAVGWIHTVELASRIIEEGKADLIAIGRPLLDDPDFVQQLKEDTEVKTSK
jgi:NADPH2 dehydrogenase